MDPDTMGQVHATSRGLDNFGELRIVARAVSIECAGSPVDISLCYLVNAFCKCQIRNRIIDIPDIIDFRNDNILYLV